MVVDRGAYGVFLEFACFMRHLPAGTDTDGTHVCWK
jgi:hypothetical protein